MKLLHTSDWHLGITFSGRSSLEDQNHFIDAICGIIREKSVGAVLLAGDVFDRSVAGGETVSFYDRIMTKIAGEMRIPLLCVAGNHDSAERLSQCSELLKKSGLYLAGVLKRDTETVELGNADVYLVPWFSIDRARAVFPEAAEGMSTLEDAWAVVADNIRKSFRPGKRHVLLTHAYAVGAETSVSDRSAEIGTAAAVGSGVFEGFDYVALGHIHKPQVIKDNICYSGCPMAYSFGKEEGQEKGVVIVDTDDMSREFVAIEPLRKRTTIRGTLDELMEADYPEDVKNGYVRLEITDSMLGPGMYALLSERYPLILEAAGSGMNGEEGDILMTLEEFEEKSKDPVEIFRGFCEDVNLGINDSRLEHFREALEECVKEA